jgi:hypothetical protein
MRRARASQSAENSGIHRLERMAIWRDLGLPPRRIRVPVIFDYKLDSILTASIDASK